MIAKLLATTALVVTLAGGAAYAANADATPSTMVPAASTLMTTGFTVTSTDVIASKMIGANVYDGAGKDANQIGTIKDLVFDQDGKIAAAVIGVGGFLGVGEKNVAVDYNQLKWGKADDGSNRVELDTTKEALNAAPTFNYPASNANAQAMNGQPDNGAAPATPGATTTAMAPATPAATAPAVAPAANDTSMTSNSGAMTANNATAPAQADVDVSKLKPVDIASMKTDDLKGIEVVNPQGQKLGAINDFVLTKDGKVDAIVIDFGGFLGIGSKQVAVGYDNLAFMTDGGSKRYLELNVTKNQLNAQQAYNKDSYAADRDQQRMTVSS